METGGDPSVCRVAQKFGQQVGIEQTTITLISTRMSFEVLCNTFKTLKVSEKLNRKLPWLAKIYHRSLQMRRHR